MHNVEGHAGRNRHTARKIERFEGDALVRAFAAHHVEEAKECQADLLAALRRPEESAGERAGAEVEAVFLNKAAPARSARADTPQLGLVGARERVEALGGELEVASESPTWVMRARIPLEA